MERVFERSIRSHHGMSKGSFEALLRLARTEGGQMSMTELADQMVLTSGGVTRLVDRLGVEGLVERRNCEHDRRIHWAHLTPQGRAKVEEVLATHLADLEAHFSGRITDDELPVVLRVLDRLRSDCETVTSSVTADEAGQSAIRS